MSKIILSLNFFVIIFCLKSDKINYLKIIPCSYYIEKDCTNDGETYQKSIKIKTVKVVANNRNAEFLLNQNIRMFDNLKPNESYATFLKKSIKSESWHTNSQTTVIYLNNNFIVFKQLYNNTPWGAVNGEFDIFYMNYDLNENNKIYLDDIFESNKINTLKQVCVLKIIQKHKLKNINIGDIYFYENFAITEKGMLFSFKLDQVYRTTINIFIPFSDLKYLIKCNEQQTQRIIN